jgi:hypothetical protein
MSVQIDEAWSYDKTVRIDGFFGEAGCTAADLSNFAILDPDISAISRHASTVDDRTAFNEDVHVRHFVTSNEVGAGLGHYVTCAED